jgi:hypothetical protein
VSFHQLKADYRFYVPSVTKSLSILDKGIRERVTKNGETLRRFVSYWSESRRKLTV